MDRKTLSDSLYTGRLIADLVDCAARVSAAKNPKMAECGFEDHAGDCSQVGVVHLLGSDYDFCLEHFRKVTR